MLQLDLFNVNGFGHIAKPSTIAPTQPQPNFTIERNPSPLKGYRVVLAPGLTHATLKNPCFCCPKSEWAHKDYCSEFCKMQPERDAYLKQIGAGLISATNADGSYGFGA